MLHSMPRLLGRTFVAVAATHIYSTNGIDTAYSDTIPSTAAAAAVTASTPKTSVTLSQSTNQSKYIYNAEERKRMFENIVILSGSSNPILSSRIVDHLGTSITHMDVHRFSDGEVSCVINESIRGKDVFLIQTCGAPVNDNIMELLLTVTAARRSGANRIVAVVPYFGYKYHKRGLPISSLSHSRFLWSASNDLAKMLQAVGVDAVLSVDLERPGQGHEACFFDCSIPVETLTSVNMYVQTHTCMHTHSIYSLSRTHHIHTRTHTCRFVNYFKNNVTLNNKVIVVSPNTECVKRAKKFQKKLKQVTGKDILYGAFISHSTVEMGKKRMKDNEVIFGDVAGADVIIIDDIVETGATLNTLCRALKKKGTLILTHIHTFSFVCKCDAFHMLSLN